MKNFFAAASLLIALAATTVVAQTTQNLIPPVSGAAYLGSYSMDLAIMSAPQPDLEYATEDNDRAAVDVHVWSISGTNGNPDEIVISTNGNQIMDWAKNDPVYHTASEQYVFERVGANIVWIGNALGFDLNPIKTRVYVNKTNADGSVITTSLAYQIVYNGGNTEVYLLGDGKS